MVRVDLHRINQNLHAFGPQAERAERGWAGLMPAVALRGLANLYRRHDVLRTVEKHEEFREVLGQISVRANRSSRHGRAKRGSY